jgi:hypothetical protein
VIAENTGRDAGDVRRFGAREQMIVRVVMKALSECHDLLSIVVEV